MDFHLSTYFASFDADKEPEIELGDVEAKLEEITAVLAPNPEAINYNTELFEELLDLVHGFKTLLTRYQKQLTYMVGSSFQVVCRLSGERLNGGDFSDYLEGTRDLLEKYGYLVFVLLRILSKEDYTKGQGKGSKNTEAGQKWNDNCEMVLSLLPGVEKAMELKLSMVFQTTPEQDLFVELFSRPINVLMESPERMKKEDIRVSMFRSLALAVKRQGHASYVQHSIIQNLTYYAHLPPLMAELCNMIATQYDYMVLAEEVLREVSQAQFNANDNNGPRAISDFLVRLSEVGPRVILKQLSCVSQLLDNSNYTLRCAVIETCGNIVVDLILKEQQDEAEWDEKHGSEHIHKLLDLLEARTLDQNPFARSKAFQAMAKVLDKEINLSTRRVQLMRISVRSTDDRSTLVRRNAMKLMSKLIKTHNFSQFEGKLDLDDWMERLTSVANEFNKHETDRSAMLKQKLKMVTPDKHEPELDDNNDNMDEEHEYDRMDIDEENNEEDKEDSTDDIQHEIDNSVLEQEDQTDMAEYYRAKFEVNYYYDAVAFIKLIHEGTESATRLLFSRNRNEVLDAMDFIVLADSYGIQNAEEGVRRMLHLVWMKGSSDEGKSIPTHLIDCYRILFLTAPPDLSVIEKATFITKNLINLCCKASIADLASLEKLIGLMYKDNLINFHVINVLWQIYRFKEETQSANGLKQRYGAIILLGMLGLEDYTVIEKGVEPILSIGLGDIGIQNLSICKYSCIALQRIVSDPAKNARSNTLEIPKQKEIIEELKKVLILFHESSEWYSVAEQAIAAIFVVAPNPDTICSEILKVKTDQVFKELPSENQEIGLSQLLFMVGHSAIKTVVYLEKLEGLFKKKKHDSETANKNKETKESELAMIGGTSEDDFADVIIHIKEKELLFGENSLLGRYGQVVIEICTDVETYNSVILQRSATLCLVKLMCISSAFCDNNLERLLLILHNSNDPIIRCNCILGLGDMAVCFNNLVDENTESLYGRLTDDNIMVQRTCLMTVTFLILAGQVKVKGQLSSMAKCLENPDQGISDMCRLFFTELASKDNAIYNGFIDIFSGLSTDESLSKDAMKRIVKFLILFITKEKQQKQLAEKLLVRLNKCQSQAQWDDVAFVLNNIPYKNDLINQAIEGGYKMVLARSE